MRLKHRKRLAIILLAILNCHNFRPDAAYGEREICCGLTATKSIRAPRCLDGCPGDEQLRRLFWFLLVPGKIGFLVGVQKILAGPAVDGDPLPCGHSQGAWRLGHHDGPRDTCNHNGPVTIYCIINILKYIS